MLKGQVTDSQSGFTHRTMVVRCRTCSGIQICLPGCLCCVGSVWESGLATIGRSIFVSGKRSAPPYRCVTGLRVWGTGIGTLPNVRKAGGLRAAWFLGSVLPRELIPRTVHHLVSILYDQNAVVSSSLNHN